MRNISIIFVFFLAITVIFLPNMIGTMLLYSLPIFLVVFFIGLITWLIGKSNKKRR